jgi:hypothetical protein
VVGTSITLPQSPFNFFLAEVATSAEPRCQVTISSGRALRVADGSVEVRVVMVAIVSRVWTERRSDSSEPVQECQSQAEREDDHRACSSNELGKSHTREWRSREGNEHETPRTRDHHCGSSAGSAPGLEGGVSAATAEEK